MAVLAIVNLATAVAGLFANAPGTASLQNLQVEMLKQISVKLDVIQAGIVDILNSLQELKEIVLRIPDETVVTFYKDTMAGLFGVYSDLIREYQLDGFAHQIQTQKRVDWLDRLRRLLLERMQLVRHVLTEIHYESPVLVPLLCSASFIEIHAMILAGYSHTQKLVAIDGYKDWLTKILQGPGEDNLSAMIAAARRAQKENVSSIPTPEQFVCYRVNPTPPFGGGQAPQAAIKFTYKSQISETFLFSGRNLADYHVDLEVPPAIDKMIAEGLLPDEEKPRTIYIDFDGPPGQPMQFYLPNVPQPDCDQARNERHQAGVALSRKLEDRGLQLMSLYALRHAATEGLRFLTRVEKEL